MLRLVMSTGINFKRPVSVEGERLALTRRRNRRHLYLGLVLVALGAWMGLGARRIGTFLNAVKSKIGL